MSATALSSTMLAPVAAAKAPRASRPLAARPVLARNSFLGGSASLAKSVRGPTDLALPPFPQPSSLLVRAPKVAANDAWGPGRAASGRLASWDGSWRLDGFDLSPLRAPSCALDANKGLTVWSHPQSFDRRPWILPRWRLGPHTLDILRGASEPWPIGYRGAPPTQIPAFSQADGVHILWEDCSARAWAAHAASGAGGERMGPGILAAFGVPHRVACVCGVGLLIHGKRSLSMAIVRTNLPAPCRRARKTLASARRLSGDEGSSQHPRWRSLTATGHQRFVPHRTHRAHALSGILCLFDEGMARGSGVHSHRRAPTGRLRVSPLSCYATTPSHGPGRTPRHLIRRIRGCNPTRRGVQRDRDARADGR